MPVTDQDRNKLAWLVVDDQAPYGRILRPVDAQRPRRPVQPVQNPVLVGAGDDDEAMRSDGEDYTATDSTDMSEDEDLQRGEGLRNDERRRGNLIALEDVEVPGPDVVVPRQLDQSHESDSLSSDEEPVTDDDEFRLLPNWVEYRFAKPGPQDVVAPGVVRFSGDYWPEPLPMRQEIEAAYAEARAMVVSGLAVAERALAGDPAAMQTMTYWFGARPNVVAATEDWWRGVRLILAKLHRYRGFDVHVYFNGEETVEQQQDWPRAGVYENTFIDEEDVEGYGASTERAEDMVVVFNKEYCSLQALKVPTHPAYTNAASVIVHELTHCLGDSADHEVDGRRVYDYRVALAFAAAHPAQAWYNAANLEYFCVEAHHGDVNGARAAFWQFLMT